LTIPEKSLSFSLGALTNMTDKLQNPAKSPLQSGLTWRRGGREFGSQALRDPAKLILLFNASKALASTSDLDQLLAVIVGEVRFVLNCEGAAVVLYDPEKDDFYWRTVEDKGDFLASAREEIRIPKDQGVVGWVFSTGEPALINDAANEPRLYRPVEDKSGFRPRNLICVPLQTKDKRLGALYALGKVEGSFTDEDVEIMEALSSSIALALDNASYYESLMKSHTELERLNRVKTKMLHHLSHELMTPLAVIEASLRLMERRLHAERVDASGLPFERIRRNLERLKTMEKQVSFIIEEKEYEQRELIVACLDTLNDFMEITEEEEPDLRGAMEALRMKMEEYYPGKMQEVWRLSTTAAFQGLEFRVKAMTKERTLDVIFEPPDPAILKIQPHIMLSVIGGLIRNAIENTPDHGKITVTGRKAPSGYTIRVRDFGVGIPESEQPNIFEGFYPVQETELYSSRSPYEFNAGGTGADLLKIKIFAERFGFSVGFKSQRCTCIPTPRDICPGDIDKCESCASVEDCYRNGGSEFVIDIPPALIEEETAG
jgi:signal transduction histidine kinase